MPRIKLRIILPLVCAIGCYLAFSFYTRERVRPSCTDQTQHNLKSSNRTDANKSQEMHRTTVRHIIAKQKPEANDNQELPRLNSSIGAHSDASHDDSNSHSKIAQEPMESKCKIYQELRNVDFRQAALKRALCNGVEAYVRVGDAYPMCQLPKPFNERILGIIRNGSATTDLMDMRNSKVTMFVYPEKDFISEAIKKSHQWEPAMVHTTLRFAQQVPNATFLDAGCNIGVYSVLAARLGLPVVALDANIRNLLRLRLTLNAASLDASLVWNFIGSGDQLSYLNFPGDCNVGGATKFGRAVRDTIPVMPVRSESLCGLIKTSNIVIKLDVEGGEADFLRTSGRLFSDFKVAAVQMEFLRRHMVGNDSSTIVDFFSSKRYSAWKMPELSELNTKSASSSWGDGDLMWVHEEFKHIVSEVRKAK